MDKKIAYTLLSLLFVVTWIWAAIEPLHHDDWVLENILVFITIPIVFWTGHYFKFSMLSYLFITLFMILHVIGSHYTYAEVPWGFTLGEWLGSQRNMYDRLIHLLFGVLIVYPFREIVIRIAKIKDFWSYLVPFMIITAMAGGYEVMEWITADMVDPEAGIAFLGTQDDIWDAQKDIFVAMIGGFATLVI
ncbi:MAG: hypothetical protein KU29_11645, partial [Sulfurovum sp. FS06-10]